MQKKLTITLDEKVYHGLHSVIGRGNIGRFIESLIRSHVVDSALDAAYREMSADEGRELEALEWAEATVGDVSHETRRGVVGELRTGSGRRNPKKKTGRNRQ